MDPGSSPQTLRRKMPSYGGIIVALSLSEATMRYTIIGSFVIGGLLCGGAPAMAQRRVPFTGGTAVGFEGGAFVPSDDEFASSPTVGAFVEYYATPRVSIRGDVGFASPGHVHESSDTLRQIPVRVGLDYNWERGRWHPFVGGGGAAGFVQFKGNGRSVGAAETKEGVNGGGGVEYFLNRKAALKGEVRYHSVGRANAGDPSGLAIAGGLKTYF